MRTTASNSSRVELAVRLRARGTSVEQLVLAPFARTRPRRRSAARGRRAALAGSRARSSSPRAHRVEQRRALDQLVARQREEPPLRHAADRVARAADALQERRRSSAASRAGRRDRRRRCRCRARATRSRRAPCSSPRLSRCSASSRRSSREAAVVRGDRAPRRAARTRCRATRSAMRRVLTKTSVVRCSRDELREAVVDLLPRPRSTSPPRAAIGGSSSARSRSRAWPASTIAQSASAPRRAPTRKRATSSIGFCVADRPMRTSGRPGERLEPLERQREVAAALVRARARGSRRRSPCAPSRASSRPDSRVEQDVERLGRRDDDVRRPLAHARALALRRVAGAHAACGSRRRAGPSAASSARMPASGASRLRWMSFESALSGET